MFVVERACLFHFYQHISSYMTNRPMAPVYQQKYVYSDQERIYILHMSFHIAPT